MRSLILLGAPGAGKGTQGALLTKRYGTRRIATGDLLRDAVRRGTPLGQKAKGFLDAGELVPDDVVLDLVREVLAQSERSGVVFDGFPRTLPQAEGLDRLLDELDQPLEAVVVIEVPEDVLVQRLSGRRQCPHCGAVHNVYFTPPRQPGVCDRCGANLAQRSDDDAATVRRRLTVYREQTEPLVAYYRRRGTPVHVLKGDGSAGDVHRDLVRILER
ncbi:MAG: adenylate kinase [Gemmatimonadetes bacterium]|nr:adenylate kinase [Gemmatimonadota bacterium]